jgi:MoaA/NifB/PqqE/SkfB family radical SAM enzyme
MKAINKETEDYIRLLATSIKKQEPIVPPLSASLQANKRCNSRCEYCGIWQSDAKDPPVEDLLVAVIQLADLGVRMISLTGGEPFLHPQLPQVIQQMDQHGILSSTMTNGLMLNPNKLIPILEAGLNSLCVSLDTVDPGIYRSIRGVPIDPVLNGLRYVSNVRKDFPSLVIFSINCVISKANIHSLVPLIEFCSELNIKVGFQPLHNSFDSTYNPKELRFFEEDLSLLNNQIEMLLKMKRQGYLITSDNDYLLGFPDYLVYKRLPEGTTCTAGYTTIAIDTHLNVKSCWPMKPVGNLHTQSLKEIWTSDTYKQHRSAMLALDCPGCWLRCHTEYLSVSWLNDLQALITEAKSERHK